MPAELRPLCGNFIADIRQATGGEHGLLASRDHGFFTVAVPNFWERPELSRYFREVRLKPDKYEWLRHA
jgi:type IV secretion system protein VirD4